MKKSPFTYVEAYGAARSCLGALADISDFDDSCRYEHLLIDIDGIHGDDIPATCPMLGIRQNSWRTLRARSTG